MKVLGKRVLIEQKMVMKESKIILGIDPTTQDGLAKNPDVFDITYKVIGIGDECPYEKIKIGDIPIFGKHAMFNPVKVEKRSETETYIFGIVHYDDIEGIDDAPVVNKKMLN